MVKKKKGVKMGLKCCKLLKTHIDKMPFFRHSTIFMKTNEIELLLHYVDEKTSC